MDALFKNNTYNILEPFIEFPDKEFSIRGLARQLQMSHATVLKHIIDLHKLGLVNKKKSTLYSTYHANTGSQKYKIYKKNWIHLKIVNSGLIEFIEKNTLPSSIILFGSGAKGTFTEKSDLDIFVESKETRVDLNPFEKRLRHSINLLFEPNINNLSKELRNNILNGIILHGFIKINQN